MSRTKRFDRLTFNRWSLTTYYELSSGVQNLQRCILGSLYSCISDPSSQYEAYECGSSLKIWSVKGKIHNFTEPEFNFCYERNLGYMKNTIGFLFKISEELITVIPTSNATTWYVTVMSTISKRPSMFLSPANLTFIRRRFYVNISPIYFRGCNCQGFACGASPG